MAYEYQNNERHEIVYEDDEIYQIKIDRSLYQEMYHHLIQSIEEVITQQSQKEQIMAIVNVFIADTSNKLKSISEIITKNVVHFKMQIKEKEQEIYKNHEKIDFLAQTNEILHSKIQNWQKQYENLKIDSSENIQKYERKLRQVKKEKKEIKQTFRMVQQNTEIERMLLENLQLQKQQISQLIVNQKKQKEQLIDQLLQLQHKYQETTQQLKVSNKKLSWQQKKIQQLQQQIRQKDGQIVSLQRKISELINNDEQGYEMNKNEDFQMINLVLNEQVQEKNGEEMNRRVSFVERNHLSDEINGFQEYENIKSFISVVRSDKQHLDYEAINKSIIAEPNQPPERLTISQPLQASEVNMPNFYFAHFLLTCQSMKLKLNREEYLWVDLSTKYKDILDEGIPFHMWDEWIIKKLKQLVKNI